ncbi:variant erythrocyte surface antigen-1 family protein [Babesia caballi]|uniref:Variant erythrocyte surface antigen-1 family protein n=1 Tax=Babesia caballi TaxID=5871 RepID=A0AAV4LZT0_BABCB|nr:variant erythrocyte surface antigen-1 family protein [Babesia caballi]
MGFNSIKFNESISGQQIASQLQSAFSSELQTAYDKAKPNPPQNSIQNIPRIFPYPPASTSLFDCPSNLKEAIDWIVRVTGKDGQDGAGQNGTDALTQQVKTLLESVKNSDSGVGHEIEKVIGALNGSGDGLIAKLADGLQQFIGYDGKSNGRPKLTGGGILPANVAKHQVCNALLNFVIRFLEGLCGIESLVSQKKDGVLEVVEKLRKCVGTGTVPTGFQQLVQKIGEKVKEIDKKIKQHGSDGKLNNVFHALKDISDDFNNNQQQGPKVEANELDSFFSVVDSAVQNDNNLYFSTYCDRLKSLFGDNELKGKAQQDSSALTYSKLKANIQGITGATTNLNNEIRSIKAMTSKANLLPNAAVFTAVRDAAYAFIADLQTKKYTSYYDKKTNPQAEWSNVSRDDDKNKCAKIFLGCLPLYYQALTYIYWGCHEKGGGCGNLTLANGAMRSYFDSQGLLPTFVESSRTGAHIADSALKGFTEFGTAASSSLSTTNIPYVSFTNKLQKNVTTNGNNLSSQCPLSALFYGASCYFRCEQTKVADKASRGPQTIREMLCFLAALQFSPQYDEFDGYVTEYFKGIVPNSQNKNDDSELKLQVADSGQKSGGNTLSAADLKSYLTSTFHLAPAFIGLIQEPSKSGEPWLHSLYSNSQFNLSIPSSGSALFNMLSNYTYALQFQLSFLYIQCRNTYTVGCGWQECRFGKDVNSGSNNSAPSHICNGYTCKDPSKCWHNGTNNSTGGSSGADSTSCKHNQGGYGSNCGKSGNLSPLQAFLTDCLPGFSRGHPSDPSSHLATCSGYMCHVPMGFNPNDLRAESNANTQGSHISLALGSFCGGFNTPLRQLSEKLGCLTKRTPRTLGDMFGFTWHLKAQLSATLNNITNAEWLRDLKVKLPFSYQLTSESGQKLNKFVGTGHSGHSTADLSSLYSSGCKEKGNNCGPYLYPLTHSDGATFGKPAPYASTYLSWVLYLTDELETGLQELLDTFKNIDCSKSGCIGKSQCNHSAGQHGSSNCSCPSVVDCADVLPLLYRHGFRFLSAFRLKGMKNEGIGKGYSQTAETKRQCSAFATQLQSVISGNPLSDLLTSIDEFLYLFRFYFLYKLSAFWSIYISLILYTFFFLLDTLHLRSHLKLTSSHVVPPLALLTSGTLLPVTKLTYIGQ